MEHVRLIGSRHLRSNHTAPAPAFQYHLSAGTFVLPFASLTVTCERLARLYMLSAEAAATCFNVMYALHKSKVPTRILYYYMGITQLTCSA